MPKICDEVIKSEDISKSLRRFLLNSFIINNKKDNIIENISIEGVLKKLNF